MRRHVPVPSLALALVFVAILVSGIPLAHAHDASAPGLYSAQCPLLELAGHTATPALWAPVPLRVDGSPAPVPAIADEVRAGPSADRACPRAPPAA